MNENLNIVSAKEIKKQETNEENTKVQYITPVLNERWSQDADCKILLEYKISAGRVDIENKIPKRQKEKRADYLLFAKNNIPLAVIEAKGIEHDASEGYQQAIDYAIQLKVPFAYATNGIDIIEEDLLTGQNRTFKMIDFPYPADLWERYLHETGRHTDETDLLSYPDYMDPLKPEKKPRYYQRIAINRTLEAILNNKQRMLICLATGTGKTYTVFQIAWKLYHTKTKRKILYLVDRDTLATQTMQKDFKPFVDLGVMKRMNRKTLLQDTSYEVFIALYQQLIDKTHDYYKELPSDFFDLIIVDECHRGSADTTGNWHRMLDYFSSATQIGLTATPKETEDVSNIAYFCQETDNRPIYTYSLKQGIEDGYLAPYRVISVELNIDKEGYIPKPGELDINGNPVRQEVYTQKDFDRKIVVDSRRKTVAKRITEYLIDNDCRYSKTIVFCEDREHAAVMTRLLRKMNNDIVKDHPKYIMRIVSNDKEGEKEVENFVEPSEKFPVIAVTSRLLSTGVDTETCELIVLDKSIGSLTEFKQTIGRGTRIKENYTVDKEEKSKLFFTIMDFRKNYLQFKDPSFDGDPVCVLDVGENDSFPKGNGKEEKSEDISDEEDFTEGKKQIKYHVTGSDVFLNGEIVSYLDEEGNLVRENLESCVRNNIIESYPVFEEFQAAWKKATDKNTFANNLLMDISFITKARKKMGFHADKYDIISLYGYGREPLTKKERLDKILQSDLFTSLPEDKQTFMKLVLEEYLTTDYCHLKDTSAIFSLPKIKDAGYTLLGVLKKMFNGKENYIRCINQFEDKLYE